LCKVEQRSALRRKCFFEFFESFLAIFFTDNSQDHNIAGNNAVINPEVTASHAIQGRVKSSEFLDAAFSESEG